MTSGDDKEMTDFWQLKRLHRVKLTGNINFNNNIISFNNKNDMQISNIERQYAVLYRELKELLNEI